MQVTLMTDASVDQAGNAGYGFWCVSNRSNGLAGGSPLKGYVKDSYQAEAKGVVSAIIQCIKKGNIKQGDTVLVQLDNAGVINLFSNPKANVRVDLIEVKAYLEELISKYDLTLKYRHVKGHSTTKGNRYTANKLCDMRANKARKEATRINNNA
jgi:ribonuclease HI